MAPAGTLQSTRHDSDTLRAGPPTAEAAPDRQQAWTHARTYDIPAPPHFVQPWVQRAYILAREKSTVKFRTKLCMLHERTVYP